MRRRDIAAAAAGAVVATVLAGSVAWAAIPGDGGVYSACMLKNVGTVRLIDKSLPPGNLMSHCKPAFEVEITWSNQGPQGLQGIQGTKGDRGEQGIQGIQGPTGQAGASGADGQPGAAGPPGERGPAGQDGAPGAQGSPGVAGTNGVSGYEVVTASGEGGSVIVQCPVGKAILQGSYGFEGPAAPFSANVVESYVINSPSGINAYQVAWSGGTSEAVALLRASCIAAT